MVKQNLHCHTTYDDGANTPEEMILAAEKAGLKALGITLHAPIEGQSWTAPKENEQVFIDEMHALKEKYQGRIDVYCGLEYDLFGPRYFEPYDYIVASGHVLEGHWVDNNIKSSRLLIEHFGGEIGALQAYYENCAKIADIPEADIVGHFDLLTKYNDNYGLYDTTRKEYKDAAFAAMEKLVKAEKIFEMNTGAISRGYRTTPYPSMELLKHLRSLEGRLCICSDAHFADAVACGFELCEAMAKEAGFTELWLFDGEKFYPEKF